MNTTDIESERKRFAGVMDSRKTDGALIELFEKLAVSDKFAEAAKPYCFADLIAEAARRVAETSLPRVMDAVDRSNAARQVRASLDGSARDKALCGLVRRLFSVTPREEAPLMRVFDACGRVGIAPEPGFTLGLAMESGMPIEDLDEICDLSLNVHH
ncbi:hypothetical protein AB4Y45_33790 [Paraburkholderia sp. EG287A]|uniref:hypothetical protein n=1 Tax=Paraburkholderia sp. EG287A TaxID=3237012 RepID=UPI0034D1BAD5